MIIDDSWLRKNTPHPKILNQLKNFRLELDSV